MDYTLEPLADYGCHTGEGPLYHPTENAVYWTDIPAGRLFRYELATGRHHPIEIGRPVGGFTLQADGALLLFLDQGAIAVWRAGAPLDYLIDEISGESESRFNDVIADPEGRVFCGTMPTPVRRGRLYRLDTDITLTKVLEGVGCSNGMGFTADRRHFYHTDSTERSVSRYDYAAATAVLTKKRLLVSAEPEGGVPDGMTVDAQGNIWSARWDGSCLVQYNHSGTELGRIPFPVKKVSSVVFGGENYDQMFVTTAGGNNKAAEGELAGTLFRLTVAGVRGVPEFFSRIGL